MEEYMGEDDRNYRAENKLHRKKTMDEYMGEDDRNYRAEKKRKVREKAAALLNRVKSQEYMRTYDIYGREPIYDYYEGAVREDYEGYYRGRYEK